MSPQKRALALGLALLGAACPGGDGAPSITDPGAEAPACATSDTDAVRLALAPTCVSCHGAGTARPFFASLPAFEDLLAYDPRYVVRGQPEASPLMALLEGRGAGAFRQMPLAGEPFAALADRGTTKISMQGVRDWIARLPEAPERGGPRPDAPTTRRLTTEEFLRTLQVALGRAPTGGRPPLLSSDIQPLSPDSPAGVDYNDGRRRQYYLLLGGASHIDGRPPERGYSPSSLLAITQIALSECGGAVKAASPVLLKHARLTDRLPGAEAAIRANLAYLHGRFLGLDATAADTEALLSRVYRPAEARGTAAAWTEVCAALVRDPRFLTF